MKKFLLSILMVLSLISVAAQPSAEVRAIWFTTNSGSDWPVGKYTESDQKKLLGEMLDRLQQANFNTIIFQAQVKGDVLWKSKKQPALISITGDGSLGLSYDVSAYVIEECHKRGMECHAWIVPYRIGSQSEANRYKNNPVKHPTVTNPELCVLYSGAYYLDPGNPATNTYLLDVYRELVENYDFDGINFDYTRYPGSDFNDASSYSKYNPGALKKDDWRRNNINTFIAQMYAMVKSIKPWMKVGAAPIGTYKNVSGFGNMTAYGSVYQDACQWMQSGNHDLLIPQMYWNEQYGFTPNMQTWVDNAAGRQLVIGLAPYKMLDNNNNWAYTEIVRQIGVQRANPGTSGVCFFRTDNVIGTHEKSQQLYNALKNDLFKYPAKIPVMDYLDITSPNPPQSVTFSGKTLSWKAPEPDNLGTPIRHYVVYKKKAGSVTLSDPSAIVGITPSTSFEIPGATSGDDYAVTAIDRNNCESPWADMAGTIEVEAETVEIGVFGQTLSVKAPVSISSLEIYSLQGVNLLGMAPSLTAAQINLNELPQGILLLSLRLADGTVVNKKIIH